MKKKNRITLHEYRSTQVSAVMWCTWCTGVELTGYVRSGVGRRRECLRSALIHPEKSGADPCRWSPHHRRRRRRRHQLQRRRQRRRTRARPGQVSTAGRPHVLIPTTNPADVHMARTNDARRFTLLLRRRRRRLRSIRLRTVESGARRSSGRGTWKERDRRIQRGIIRYRWISSP